MTVDAIKERVEQRGIRQLCHATRSMTLPFIIERGEIVATSRLAEDDRAVYYPNDDLRLDGHKTHVSCTIQYPNAWYLRNVRGRETLFRDWVVLTIDPLPLWSGRTLFSPVNAATAHGAHIGSGSEAFEGLFASFPRGGRFARGLVHLNSCPTDNQAEVLVEDGIPLDLVRCVVVQDEAQAARERWRLRAARVPLRRLRIAVCPEFFDPRVLAGRIASGQETDLLCQAI